MRKANPRPHPWCAPSLRPVPNGGSVPHASVLGFATRVLLVDPGLTFLSGHCIKSSRFLFDILAAALRTLRVRFMFPESENQFEGFVTIVANVVIHGHGGLPLDCDHELLVEL
jgi:hypothetical protein